MQSAADLSRMKKEAVGARKDVTDDVIGGVNIGAMRASGRRRAARRGRRRRRAPTRARRTSRG